MHSKRRLLLLCTIWVRQMGRTLPSRLIPATSKSWESRQVCRHFFILFSRFSFFFPLAAYYASRRLFCFTFSAVTSSVDVCLWKSNQSLQQRMLRVSFVSPKMPDVYMHPPAYQEAHIWWFEKSHRGCLQRVITLLLPSFSPRNIVWYSFLFCYRFLLYVFLRFLFAGWKSRFLNVFCFLRRGGHLIIPFFIAERANSTTQLRNILDHLLYCTIYYLVYNI